MNVAQDMAEVCEKSSAASLRNSMDCKVIEEEVTGRRDCHMHRQANRVVVADTRRCVRWLASAHLGRAAASSRVEGHRAMR